MKITQEEKNNNSVDMVAALTIEALSKAEKKSTTELLPQFLASRTAHTLYDESSKLWWDGPSAIAQMYMDEVAGK